MLTPFVSQIPLIHFVIFDKAIAVARRRAE
jgi:hypothetical protein